MFLNFVSILLVNVENMKKIQKYKTDFLYELQIQMQEHNACWSFIFTEKNLIKKTSVVSDVRLQKLKKTYFQFKSWNRFCQESTLPANLQELFCFTNN